MILECPICKSFVNSADFKILRGAKGGFNCPACGKMLHFTQGDRPVRIALALIISLLATLLIGIRKLPEVAAATIVVWPLGQIFINSNFAHFFRVGLKPWRSPIGPADSK
jgi:hypothetical protein